MDRSLEDRLYADGTDPCATGERPSRQDLANLHRHTCQCSLCCGQEHTILKQHLQELVSSRLRCNGDACQDVLPTTPSSRSLHRNQDRSEVHRPAQIEHWEPWGARKKCHSDWLPDEQYLELLHL